MAGLRSAAILYVVFGAAAYAVWVAGPGGWVSAGVVAGVMVAAVAFAWVVPADHSLVAPVDEGMPLEEVEKRVRALFPANKVAAPIRAPRSTRGGRAVSVTLEEVDVQSGRAVGAGVLRGEWTAHWDPPLPDGTVEEKGRFAADASWRLERWPWPKLALGEIRTRSELFEGLLDMVPIPAGTFWMGSREDDPEGMDWEKPQHQQTVGEFILARTPTTAGQWSLVMGRPWPEQPDLPLVEVSWFEAVEFCRVLSRLAGRSDPYAPVASVWASRRTYEHRAGATGFSLPSEPQWEYACRAGTTTPYWFGPDTTKADEFAWFGKNSDLAPEPVATKPANPWGLHDMAGNVWEWCGSAYDLYPAKAQIRRPVGADRVLRGGSFFYEATILRSAYRVRYLPGDRRGDFGFRCAGPSLPSSDL